MNDLESTTMFVAPDVVYGVCWIEVEYGWGSRPSGWFLFLDKETAHTESRKSSDRGNFDGGYIGPERPIEIYSIPWQFLPDEAKTRLASDGKWGSGDFWGPEYKKLVR